MDSFLHRLPSALSLIMNIFKSIWCVLILVKIIGKVNLGLM